MSTDTQALNTIRHGQYYIPNADLCLMVEQFIFKVHRYFFERESEYFAKKLAVPTSAGGSLPGSADNSAIILDRVTPAQFSNFLWVFYNPKFSLYEAELPVWQDILVLAHRWVFPEVKSLAIREIERKDMTDVARIKLYQDNRVDRSLLIPRYAALTEREDPINLEEGIDLGLETVLKIAAAREKARGIRQANGSLSPSTPTARGQDLFEVIRDVFKIDETAEAPAFVAPTATTVPAAAPSGGLKTSTPPVLAKPVPVLEVKTPVVKKPTTTAQESTPSPLPQNQKKELQKLKQQQQTAAKVNTPSPVNPKTSSSTSNPLSQAQGSLPTTGPIVQGQGRKGPTKKENKNKKNAKGGAAGSQAMETDTEVETRDEVKTDVGVNIEADKMKVDGEEAKPDVPAKDATKVDEETPLIDVVPPTAGVEAPIEATRPPIGETKVGEENVDSQSSTPDPTNPTLIPDDAEKTNGTPKSSAAPSKMDQDVLVDLAEGPVVNPFGGSGTPILPETPSQSKGSFSELFGVDVPVAISETTNWGITESN